MHVLIEDGDDLLITQASAVQLLFFVGLDQIAVVRSQLGALLRVRLKLSQHAPHVVELFNVVVRRGLGQGGVVCRRINACLKLSNLLVKLRRPPP